ncbi:hypothetical protein JCM10213_004493 [Rhodosporidiobolus nylandii]
MAKSSNPVDAHRKAQRKAELKKNKQARTKQKEVATVKTDTRPLQADIKRLQEKGNLNKAEKDELAQLKGELARVQKAKQDYVEAHPEHRKFVFPDRPGEGDSAAAGPGGADPPGLYDKSGRLKHPERSLYYDPVYNPFGVPPPGMPYREKPEYEMARLGIPTPEQLAAFQPILPAAQASDEDEDSDEDDSDDDITMPAGPPPGEKAGSSSDSDSSDDEDDIPLPPGPPPPKPGSRPPQPVSQTTRPLISRPSGRPHPPPFPQHHQQPYRPQPLPSRPAFLPPTPSLPPPPGAPAGPRNPNLPARPPPPSGHMSDPLQADGSGPQRAFQQGRPVPAGPVFPAEAVAAAATVSAPPAPSPFLPIPGAVSAAAGAATISAAPQLRDLKAEATAFVPAAMRKKMAKEKAQLAKVGLSAVNAAPSSAGAAGSGEEAGTEKKQSLLESMRERGIGALPPGMVRPPPQPGKKAGDEDYKRFEEEMKDFL